MRLSACIHPSVHPSIRLIALRAAAAAVPAVLSTTRLPTRAALRDKIFRAMLTMMKMSSSSLSAAWKMNAFDKRISC
jgi:hypothetical protein